MEGQFINFVIILELLTHFKLCLITLYTFKVLSKKIKVKNIKLHLLFKKNNKFKTYKLKWSCFVNKNIYKISYLITVQQNDSFLSQDMFIWCLVDVMYTFYCKKL